MTRTPNDNITELKIRTMKKTIKFFKNKDGQPCALTDKYYKGYLIGAIPKRFGFIYDKNKDQDGLTEWFNYKGITYIWE